MKKIHLVQVILSDLREEVFVWSKYHTDLPDRRCSSISSVINLNC